MKMDNFDDFVNKLQEQIFDESKEAFGEEGFKRWREPKFRGKLENHNTHAKIKGSCGDSMEFYLNIENNVVKEASYLTDGCGSSTVCGSFAAEMTLGKTLDELTDITGESILKEIGTFPLEDKHCAFLAAETINEAVNRYMKSSREG